MTALRSDSSLRTGAGLLGALALIALSVGVGFVTLVSGTVASFATTFGAGPLELQTAAMIGAGSLSTVFGFLLAIAMFRRGPRLWTATGGWGAATFLFLLLLASTTSGLSATPWFLAALLLAALALHGVQVEFARAQTDATLRSARPQSNGR